MARKRHGLPRVRHFRFEELVEAPIDLVGDCVKERGALGDVHARPLAMQRCTRGSNGRVDLFLARLGDARDEAPVYR